MIKTTTIKKGTHSPFRFPKLIPGSHHLYGYDIVFTPSCAYNLENEDQLDVNKLFGIGYFPSHHKNSVRFGWRYFVEKQQIEILSYYYKDSQRYFDHICFVNIGDLYSFSLTITDKYHELIVASKYPTNYPEYYKVEIPVIPKSIGYLLRPYFGGNQKAPHDMTIKID